MRRIGLACLLVGALLFVAFRPVSSKAAAGPGNFTCPGPPAAWTSASGGAQFWGPQQNPGADTERVTCGYLDGKGEAVSIAVNFALPTDPNPWSDFDYGCSALGTVAWSDSQRIYQAVSADHWLDVNFSDPLGLISSAEVGSFEGVARSMMAGTQGFAHACEVKVAPTPTAAGWLFDFEFYLGGNGVVAFGGIGTHVPGQTAVTGVASYAIPDGSFHVKTPAHSSQPIVASLSAPTVRIGVREHGTEHTVTIRFVRGTRFSFKMLSNNRDAAASLVTTIAVVHSTLAGCAAGARGTLSLATAPPTVSLKLCGAVFGTLKTRAVSVTIQQS